MERSTDDAVLEKGLLEHQAQVRPTLRHPGMVRATSMYADIVRPIRWMSHRRSFPKANNRLAYLDGLRGMAVLLVYIYHHEIWAHQGVQGDIVLDNAFGWDRQFYLTCIPGIRLLFTGGPFAISMLMIVSGYVLSSKGMRLIHVGDTTQLTDTVSSALFRRWFRIFLPVVATTFIWMTSWHLFGVASSQPMAEPPQPTYLAEFWKWFQAVKNFTFVYQDGAWLSYNDQVGLMAQEFRGSLLVLVTMIALSRCKRNARLYGEVALVFYFLYVVDGWWCALFVTGALLADLDLLASKDQLPAIITALEPIQSWAVYVLFGVGLYLGGVPSVSEDLEHLRKSPGWGLLPFLKPQAAWDFRWFFRYWGATFLMISIPRISWLKAFFEMTAWQLMGSVSYGFYLVTGPVLWSLGDRIYAVTGCVREGHSSVVPGYINKFPLPRFGPFGLELNFLLPHLILFPVTLWFAEIVSRFFDEPAVKLSHWLYKQAKETQAEFGDKQLAF